MKHTSINSVQALVLAVGVSLVITSPVHAWITNEQVERNKQTQVKHPAAPAPLSRYGQCMAAYFFSYQPDGDLVGLMQFASNVCSIYK